MSRVKEQNLNGCGAVETIDVGPSPRCSLGASSSGNRLDINIFRRLEKEDQCGKRPRTSFRSFLSPRWGPIGRVVQRWACELAFWRGVIAPCPHNPTGDCISVLSSGQIGGATEWLVGDVFLSEFSFCSVAPFPNCHCRERLLYRRHRQERNQSCQASLDTLQFTVNYLHLPSAGQ